MSRAVVPSDTAEHPHRSEAAYGGAAQHLGLGRQWRPRRPEPGTVLWRFEARHGVRSFQFCAGHVGWVRHGQTPGPWIMVNVLAWPLKAYEGLKTESPVHDKMPATISYIYIYILFVGL